MIRKDVSFVISFVWKQQQQQGQQMPDQFGSATFVVCICFSQPIFFDK